MNARGGARLLVVVWVVLVVCAPSPATALHDLFAGGRPDPTAPLVAALALVAWCCAGYLLSVLGLTAVGRAPGALGRLARWTVRMLAPHAVRRTAELILGVSVATSALGVVGASAHERQPAPGGRLLAPVHAPLVIPSPMLAGPPDQPAPGAGPVQGGPRTVPPLLDWPVTATPGRTAGAGLAPGGARRPVVPAQPVRARPLTYGPHARDAVTPTQQDLVVRPGDCLWTLAAQDLGPGATPARIAAAWPSWWAANRAVIGDDPDLLAPGTRLRPPPETHPGASR